MDLEVASAKDGARWAWARTGALVLFLVTAVLLVSTLNTAHSDPHAASAPAGAGVAQAQANPPS